MDRLLLSPIMRSLEIYRDALPRRTIMTRGPNQDIIKKAFGNGVNMFDMAEELEYLIGKSMCE
jgi:hypothetical protein